MAMTAVRCAYCGHEANDRPVRHYAKCWTCWVRDDLAKQTTATLDELQHRNAPFLPSAVHDAVIAELTRRYNRRRRRVRLAQGLVRYWTR